ncbi:MAG: Nudix family hydrolase [Lysobacter sp.]|nr:MAG: Nudix family hydrolase [Lysobacter sp.]
MMGGSPVVEVVAGVIRDARGRVLLARRTEGRDLAGLWEFPGGKREPGETGEEALARELHEELGIEARVGEALIRVPQQYPHKHLVLDVRFIDSWQGRARGREGQALAWVPVDRLPLYDMPPADRPVVAALMQPSLYRVTDTPVDEVEWLASLQRSFASGLRRVQLRAPGLHGQRWSHLVECAADLARGAGAEVLVNGDVALARHLGIGLHLPAAQLALLADRPLPLPFAVAASCHGVIDLARAEAIGCDFAVVGHIRPTPSHEEGTPLGWDGFVALRERTSLPLYAIGGLTPHDLPAARTMGAQGVAGIRAFEAV